MDSGIELSYARYMFFIEMGLDICNDYQILFMSQDRFQRKYGKSNKELILLYSYDSNYEEKKKIKWENQFRGDKNV